MKLLHITDLHFRTHWFEWVLSQANAYDAICISGDLLDLFAQEKASFAVQIRWVRSWIRTFPGKLYICSGNHDWWNSCHGITDTDARGGWLRKMSTLTVAVDGSRRIEGEYLFMCLPWFGIPQELASSKKVILVMHCPPSRTEVSCAKGCDNGDSALAGVLAGYSGVVLCGHIHAPTQWYARHDQALYINPGCDFAHSLPNHVVIDTEENRATYFVESQQMETISLFQGQ